ncbi:MAG: TPM domain-containing protein [Deltaproteobacteria bacterium]|nr:MAG: TPM domain-containing protein [Deltaproteobacteria bacterium]
MAEHLLTRSRRRNRRKAVNLLGAAVLVLLLAVVCAQALEVPPRPKGRVSDYTGTLSSKEIRSLDQMLATFERETTNQLAVLIIPTLAGDSLEDYSIRLAEKWQLGQKERDNGVILLIVMQDRKIRIEVGYGLEGVLPDSLAGEIIRQVLAPQFRQGQFYEGIRASLIAIIAATKGEYRPTTPVSRGRRRGGLISWVWPLFMLFLLLSSIASIFRRRRYYSSRRGGWVVAGPMWWGGGFRGGGGFGGGFSGGGGGFGGGGASGGW